MGYRLNCLGEPVFKAVPKPMPTKFGIHNCRLESCEEDESFLILIKTSEQVCKSSTNVEFLPLKRL